MAACIANALLEQEVRVLMTNFATIINGMFFATDKMDYVNAICGYDLLIIDDLGVESQRKDNRAKMMDKFREIFSKPEEERGDA